MAEIWDRILMKYGFLMLVYSLLLQYAINKMAELEFLGMNVKRQSLKD